MKTLNIPTFVSTNLIVEMMMRREVKLMPPTLYNLGPVAVTNLELTLTSYIRGRKL